MNALDQDTSSLLRFLPEPTLCGFLIKKVQAFLESHFSLFSNPFGPAPGLSNRRRSFQIRPLSLSLSLNHFCNKLQFNCDEWPQCGFHTKGDTSCLTAAAPARDSGRVLGIPPPQRAGKPNSFRPQVYCLVNDPHLVASK